MSSDPIITLTTDFGDRNPFSGIMKGVILTINPAVNIIDITHNISPHTISEAAYSLEMSFPVFPAKTIHVAVVDPEVGSPRRPIIVATDRHYFVGPDNGIFSRVYLRTESLQVIHVTGEHYFLPDRSSTFDGRDVFAPVAAWFAKGINILKFGDPITDYITLPLPTPSMPAEHIIQGEIIYIDTFGNAISNIEKQQITHLMETNPEGKLRVMIKGTEAPFKTYYSQVGDKNLYSLINSFGYLEFFTNRGNAASEFAIQVGEKVSVILTNSSS
ncbi:MAG: SAM-dependent chlorinase/fluorinase [Thermodesulfovibrionales bacterium]|nr:SAM-dependent chlorinase/fluorinase [Thermodesulfovibrionales bacterium]